MAYLGVYISHFRDAHESDKPNSPLKTPRRRSPFFPGGSEAWELFFEWAGLGKIKAVQTDWAASVAFVSKEELEVFYETLYQNSSFGDGLAHLEKQKLELRAYIDQCGLDQKHSLCASEL